MHLKSCKTGVDVKVDSAIISRLCPVMKSASLDDKNTTPLAISMGRPYLQEVCATQSCYIGHIVGVSHVQGCDRVAPGL